MPVHQDQMNFDLSEFFVEPNEETCSVLYGGDEKEEEEFNYRYHKNPELFPDIDSDPDIAESIYGVSRRNKPLRRRMHSIPNKHKLTVDRIMSYFSLIQKNYMEEIFFQPHLVTRLAEELAAGVQYEGEYLNPEERLFFQSVFYQCVSEELYLRYYADRNRLPFDKMRDLIRGTGKQTPRLTKKEKEPILDICSKLFTKVEDLFDKPSEDEEDEWYDPDTYVRTRD